MASGLCLDEIAELVDAGKVGPPRNPFPDTYVLSALLVGCAPGRIPGNTPGGGARQWGGCCVLLLLPWHSWRDRHSMQIAYPL